VELSWKNGVLAISDFMIHLDGGRAAGGRVQVDLQYVTLHARRGLLLFPGDDGADPGQVTFVCSDSIVSIGPEAALIQQQGGVGESGFDARLVWRGDRVFYENVGDFWRLDNGPEPPRAMGMESWKTYWETRAAGDESTPKLMNAQWMLHPRTGLALHQVRLGDFALVDQPDNPARTAAGDGGRVGFRSAPGLWPEHSGPSEAAGPPAPDPPQL
jgi:hypothetical protein